MVKAFSRGEAKCVQQSLFNNNVDLATPNLRWVSIINTEPGEAKTTEGFVALIALSQSWSVGLKHLAQVSVEPIKYMYVMLSWSHKNYNY